jgi:hypothetical protein
MMLTKEAIRKKARSLGFEDTGFTGPEPFEEQKKILQERLDTYSWAIDMVSPSRTSPIIITSGSERITKRKASAGVSPESRFTGTCTAQGRKYSNGSSTVKILSSGLATCFRQA